jgi:hypothetical protein
VAGKRGPTKAFPTYAEAYGWAMEWEARTDRKYRSHGIEVNRGGTPPTFADYVKTWTPGAPPFTGPSSTSPGCC